MNIALFSVVLAALPLAELLKGLSANGTPPVLQKFRWQLNFAYLMWKSIVPIRIVLAAALLFLLWRMSPPERESVAIGGTLLAALWGGIYWLFNHFWIGKHKFLPLTNPVFTYAADNKVDLAMQVIGVEWDGEHKAYPVCMTFYHHQISDTIANHPILVTYCGMCRSGRVYDASLDGREVRWSLVGAITFNAIFRDQLTGSWWRQETGEAVKGPLAGKVLADLPMEQMTLANWLAKHPDSKVLQYDPKFQQRYNFFHSLLSYEASLPGWHMQDTPPLVIGLECDGQSRAYDWNELKRHQMVMDRLGNTDLLLLCSSDGTSAFVYDRTCDGETLEFELRDKVLVDTATRSTWSQFGLCTDGPRKGAQLVTVQSYQQFLRAWVSFHANTTFYNFDIVRSQ